MSVTPSDNQPSIPAVEHPPYEPPASSVGKQTYGQILKSSALVGGASVVNIAIGVVRTKAMAVYLGTSGVGMMANFNQIVDMVQTMAGMGINSSGVRQIAEAVGTGDNVRIAQTAIVLRRISLLLGAFGALLLIAFSKPVTTFVFGTPEYTPAVILLSLAVFFRSISVGQGALIQGMRRISDLARMGILGAVFGTIISVPLVCFYGEKGVVPAIVSIAAMTTLTSWWYSRKVQIQPIDMSSAQAVQEAGSLLKLGFAFLASGLLTAGAATAVRVIVTRKIGIDGAGLYQSAWALGGLYVGFILQAMGADFYPRLTAVGKNNAECNRLVNEQALVGLLLAGPGVLVTLTFAPLVITICYTAKFMMAVEILRWLCLGLTLRVIAWPMGFIVLAKNRQMIFFWTEVAATLVHVGCAWLFVSHFGLAGAGMAFLALYVWHGILVYWVARRLSGFRWSTANKKTGLLFLPLIVFVFCGFFLFQFWLAILIGVVATVIAGFYSMRVLTRLLPANRIPAPIRKLLTRLGLLSVDAN